MPANHALNRWILDSASDFAIIATDLDGRVTTWSAGAERTLGWSEAEMCGQTVERIFTPEDVASNRPAREMRTALETGSGNDERWHMRKDGERFWANGEMTVLRDEADVALGFVKVLRDRTEQRLAAEALRKGEDDTRLLLDSMAEGFYAVDCDGVTTLCNAAFLRMMGFATRDDVVGRKLHDVIHHSHQDGSPYAKSDCPIYVCAQGGPARHVEGEYFYPVTGGRLPVEYWVIPVRRNGVLQGAICTFLDVTERRRAEEARRASEDQLRRLNADLERQVLSRSLDRGMTWQVSPDLLAVLTPDGLFESANPAWRATLGVSEVALRGSSTFDLIHPDDLAAAHAAFDTLADGKAVLHHENRLRHADGGYRWMSWVAVPEGARIYTRARDITAERAQAAALDQAQEALRQSQKLDAIGQLTGGVAHDFNNLLTVICGSVDLLRRPDISDERRTRYIDAIADTSERAARLTGQLLAFARRQALKPELFDVAVNLGAVRDIVATLAGSHVQIDLDVPPEPCFIHADPSQFDTAMVNMAVNARDAMGGRGRIAIRVGAVSGTPAVRSHPAIGGDFITVAISDTGAGIPADDLNRIFEPFYTTKSVGEGTGLGLSQVFGFAKQTGGEVIVESELDVGTCFTLYLPRVRDAQGAPAVAIADDDPMDAAPLRVLVVEDNPEVGRFATATLAELGHGTTYAANGEEALRILAADPTRFDIVFSDVVMPGMSGLELGRLVRDSHPELPVMLTSGYSHILAAKGSDGFALLHKPYSIDQLARALRAAARSRPG